MNTIKEFESVVVSETSYGIRDNYGKCFNRMELKALKGQYVIEWEVFESKDKTDDYIEFAEIGIWTEGMKVIEYDGVFELPKEALQLLKDNGFDTKEVE